MKKKGRYFIQVGTYSYQMLVLTYIEFHQGWRNVDLPKRIRYYGVVKLPSTRLDRGIDSKNNLQRHETDLSDSKISIR